MDYLHFTVESGADYGDGWLPTLDTSLVVSNNNMVNYRYFEKPTTTNTTLRSTTAMEENSKMQCLANDLVRRLLNTKAELPSSVREEVVDKYGMKILTSGYSKEQTKLILMNGMKGYMTKVKLRRKSGSRRVHRTAVESSQGRIRKKLLTKSTWYRGRRGSEKPAPKTGGGMKRNTDRKGAVQLKTRAVLFLEQTPRGELAGKMREQLARLEPTLGFKIKVVERTGRSIQSMFSQTNLWGDTLCGREPCVTCYQEGEDKPDCTRVGVVYESICTKCNPSALKKGELRSQESAAPSLYVGESSRSIQERAREHWDAAIKKEEKSHMTRHQGLVHPGEQPEFTFKLVSTHKTALSRQIREAVRIRRRGGAASILNSRSEFNRCHIPRLVVEVEDQESKDIRKSWELQERREIEEIMEQDDRAWSNKKLREQQMMVMKRRRCSETQGEEGSSNQGVKKKRRRNIVLGT